MSSLTQNVTLFLAILTVVSQIIAGIGLLILLFDKKNVNLFLPFFKKYYLRLALAVTLTATLGSLFYSEIAGFEPCKLCWFERIFMYPQTILFALAIWKKEKTVWLYSLGFSLIGMSISSYHYLLQRGIILQAPCAAVGYSASCSKVFVMTFGYITIPMMAATAFIVLILLAIVQKRTK